MINVSPVQVSIPDRFFVTVKRLGLRFTNDVLYVNIAQQRMWHFKRKPGAHRNGNLFPQYELVEKFVCSTSRYGIGEVAGSNMTPRGLHRIAEKHGGGWPTGAVFKNRNLVGYTWSGEPGGLITNRIMWLEGLEPGFNRGGNVDSYHRYIYIHGTGHEPGIGRPASHGCVHLSAADLIPLYDKLRAGTMLWIAER